MKNNFFYWLLPVTCFVGNLSQLPIYSGITQTAFKLLWAVMLLMAFFVQGRNLYFNRFVFCTTAAINGLLFLISYVWGREHVSSHILSNINLCMFIVCVAYMIGLSSDETLMSYVSLAYVSSAMICGIWVYLRYFRGVNWLDTSAYLYTSKNSFATILLFAVILCCFFLWKQYPWLSAISTLVCTVLLFMLKSRATLVCAVAFWGYITMMRPQKYWIKLLSIAVSLTVIAMILLNPVWYDIIVENIILNNKDVTDLTAVTSRRNEFFALFLQDFPEHWILGFGKGFLECFPLSVLYNFGLVGGIPILLLSLYPLKVAAAYKRANPESILADFLSVANVILWINGLFEEQPPFGPGVKCSLLWLATGLLLGILRRRQREEDQCLI